MAESVVRYGDHFLWCVKNKSPSYEEKSPCFTFADRVWGLELSYKYHSTDTKTWYSLTLRSFCEFDPSDSVKLGFKAGEGSILCNAVPAASDRKFRAMKIISYDEITPERWQQLAPERYLTVVCKIITQDASVENLLLDHKQMYLSGQHSDVVLVVKTNKIKAHRCILAARSPVFAAMFSHGMKESVSGVVTIEDNDSDTFSDFLLYLYTGMVEKLTSKNVPRLYMTADKYQVPALKDECLDFMISHITEESVCDFLNLALRHRERELIAAAKNFLSKQQST